MRRDQYKCDLCDKKFDRIQSLNKHKKRIHKENLANEIKAKHEHSQTISMTKNLI